jgi:hypothetical protein
VRGRLHVSFFFWYFGLANREPRVVRRAYLECKESSYSAFKPLPSNLNYDAISTE